MGIYGTNINVARAFATYIDGLKPVHRKSLYTMNDLKMFPNSPHRKAAVVVGTALAKYYCHGDTSIYDATIFMSQDFSQRIPYVDVNGNNGAVTGDLHAHMRYVEVKLSEYGYNVFLDKEYLECVPYIPNYDESILEPVYLPARLPNILINGSVGIGYGFSNNIPQHNVSEVINCLISKLKTGKYTELYPDYCSGGEITNSDDIQDFYKKSEGKINIRGLIENDDKDHSLIVKEVLPYMKTDIILDKLQELVTQKGCDDIIDIVDLTNKKTGIHIIIKIKKSTPLDVMKNMLLNTILKDTVSVYMTVVTNNLTIESTGIEKLLDMWLDYRYNIERALYHNRINKIYKEIIILEGLIACYNHIDEILKLVKSSNDRNTLIESLKTKYKLKQIQAEYIADIKLYRYTKMSIQSMKDELDDKMKIKESYMKILHDDNLIKNEIINDLLSLESKFKTTRKTKLSSITKSTNIDNTENIFVLTKQGKIKKMKNYNDNYDKKDFPLQKLIIPNNEELIIFTKKGFSFKVMAGNVPNTENTTGMFLTKDIAKLDNDDKIVQIFNYTSLDKENYFIFKTSNHTIKKTKVSLYDASSSSSLIAINLNKSEVEQVIYTNDNERILFHYGKLATIVETKNISTVLRTAMGMNLPFLNKMNKNKSKITVINNTILCMDIKGKAKLVDSSKILSDKEYNMPESDFIINKQTDSFYLYTDQNIYELEYNVFNKKEIFNPLEAIYSFTNETLYNILE